MPRANRDGSIIEVDPFKDSPGALARFIDELDDPRAVRTIFALCCELAPEDLAAIRRCRWLKCLCLPAFGDDELGAALEMRNLECLHVDWHSEYGPLTDDLHRLRELHELAEVRLFDVPAFDVGTLLPLADRLSGLFLGGDRITDEVLEVLPRFSMIRELGLYRCGITDDGLRNISGMSFLRNLCIWSKRKKGHGVAESDGMQSVITNAGIEHLRPLDRLEGLDLRHCAVDDEAMQILSGLCALDTLGLTATRVGNKGLSHLGRLDRLSELYLEGTEVTSDGMQEIWDLSRSLGLVTLDLEGLPIGDEDVALLASSPSLWRSLKILFLNGTNVSSNVGRYTCEFEHLEGLDLGYTSIDDRCFANGVPPNLSMLDLCGTSICGKTIQRLRPCSELSYLYADEVNLDKDDVDYLFQLRSLCVLHLLDSGIPEDYEDFFWENLPRLEDLQIGVSDDGNDGGDDDDDGDCDRGPGGDGPSLAKTLSTWRTRRSSTRTSSLTGV